MGATDRHTHRQTEQKQDAPEFYLRGLKVHYGYQIARGIYFVGVICSTLLIMFSLLAVRKSFLFAFQQKKKNNPEYKCTDDICQQSICVQAHSMANIYWTSCLQGI